MNKRIDLQKQYKLLQKQEEELHVEMSKILCELEAICKCKNFEIKPRYEGGSYYDVSKYYEYKQCKDCGKIFDERLIRTGGYN